MAKTVVEQAVEECIKGGGGTIRIYDNGMGDAYIFELFKILQSSKHIDPKKISCLYLSGGRASRGHVTEKGIKYLSEKLIDTLPALKELYLNWNHYCANSAKHLAFTFENKELPTLEQLTFYNFLLRDNDLADLSSSLEKGVLMTLSRLTLSENHIYDNGIKYLSNALEKKSALPILEYLNIHCNFYGDAGIEFLGKALKNGAMPVLCEIKTGRDKCSAKGRSIIQNTIMPILKANSTRLEKAKHKSEKTLQQKFGTKKLENIEEVIKHTAILEKLTDLLLDEKKIKSTAAILLALTKRLQNYVVNSGQKNFEQKEEKNNDYEVAAYVLRCVKRKINLIYKDIQEIEAPQWVKDGILQIKLDSQKIEYEEKELLDGNELHEAVRKGEIELLKKLSFKASNKELNETNPSDHTPLGLALLLQRYDMAELLYDKINLPNHQHKTIIHRAVKKHADIDFIMSLLHKYTTESCNILDDNGYGVIHYIAGIIDKLTDREDLLKLFILKGSDINLLDTNSNTPLHIAAQKGYKDICQLIIEDEKGKESLKIYNKDHMLALEVAALNGKHNCSKLILDNLDSAYIKNILFDAVKQGNGILLSEILRFLPEMAKVTDQQGASLIHLAKNKEIAEILLKHSGATILIQEDEEAALPIHYAVKNDRFEVVKLMLEYAVKNLPKGSKEILQNKDITAAIALHYSNTAKMTKLIISEMTAAYISYQGNDGGGRTILHKFTKKGDYNSIKVIFEYFEQSKKTKEYLYDLVVHKDKKGATALQYAAGYEDEEIAAKMTELLLTYMPERVVMRRSSMEDAAYFVAKNSGNKKVMELIKKKAPDAHKHQEPVNILKTLDETIAELKSAVLLSKKVKAKNKDAIQKQIDDIVKMMKGLSDKSDIERITIDVKDLIIKGKITMKRLIAIEEDIEEILENQGEQKEMSMEIKEQGAKSLNLQKAQLDNIFMFIDVKYNNPFFDPKLIGECGIESALLLGEFFENHSHSNSC